MAGPVVEAVKAHVKAQGYLDTFSEDIKHTGIQSAPAAWYSHGNNRFFCAHSMNNSSVRFRKDYYEELVASIDEVFGVNCNDY